MKNESTSSVVTEKVQEPIYGAECFTCGLLASGFIDVIVQSFLGPYDFLAFIPIIQGAGGIITDSAGQKLRWQASPIHRSRSKLRRWFNWQRLYKNKMAKTEKPNMLTRLKKKMTQKGRDIYMIFSGNEENFVRNGAWLLEESIALFHGKANPVRHLSVDDLNNMNVEPLPYREDGFYCLYQGSWEGRVVLVKKSSRDGFFHVELFLREIVVATQMATHNNALKILGCCLETDLPVLVYEWMPPNTLQNRICPNDANQSKAVLEWKDRLRIAWEISHVAAYLHTAFPRPIIHRHLKPSNVFLNQDNAVKLGDFSLSVSIPEGEEFIKDSKIAGTYGYMAPEYVTDGKVAKSTDVYSFGMLFLVLLTGKNSYFFSETEEEKPDIITWVRNGVKNNHVNKIVDPTITRNGLTSIEDLQLRASAQLAIRCVSKEEDCRPTMVEVATELKNMIRSLEEMSCIRSSPSREKKCKCGVPFAELTSWTRENPGRKFKTCKFYDVVTESRGCKAFEWVDEPEGTAWQTEVINNLLLDKKLLKGKITDYKREVDDLGGQMRCLLNKVDNLNMKCKALNSDRKKMIREMHGRNGRLEHSVLCVAFGISLVMLVMVVIGGFVMLKM